MLIKRDTLDGISEGRITLAFRRWKRPTVRTGGTLLTPIGHLAIESVEPVRLKDISTTEAVAASFSDIDSLQTQLAYRSSGTLYRIRFRLTGPDPRIALRERIPDENELTKLATRLSRWDRTATAGPWTRAYLTLIEKNPGIRAGDLANEIGVGKDRFKPNVRRLKGLGLTESLKVGYCLSPRGKALMAFLSSPR